MAAVRGERVLDRGVQARARRRSSRDAVLHAPGHQPEQHGDDQRDRARTPAPPAVPRAGRGDRADGEEQRREQHQGRGQPAPARRPGRADSCELTAPPPPSVHGARHAGAHASPTAASVALATVRIARFVHPGSAVRPRRRARGEPSRARPTRRADALTVAAIDGHPFGPITFTGDRWALPDVRLLSPILPSKVVAIGKNYADHAKEMGGEAPDDADDLPQAVDARDRRRRRDPAAAVVERGALRGRARRRHRPPGAQRRAARTR